MSRVTPKIFDHGLTNPEVSNSTKIIQVNQIFQNAQVRVRPLLMDHVFAIATSQQLDPMEINVSVIMVMNYLKTESHVTSYVHQMN